MMCYWQGTDSLSNTKQMRIALSSKMDWKSGKTTEKLVTSNTTNFSYQRNQSVMYYGASTQNLEKYPVTTKTIFAYRQKYSYPKVPQLMRESVMSCEQCIRESRNNRNFMHFPYRNLANITAPEDAMQIDLVPEIPPSGCFENTVVAMDKNCRFFLTYPTYNQDDKTIAKVMINIMIKNGFSPTMLIWDRSSAFVSHIIKDFGITLKHATTKHAQTIGLLERSHASIKQPWKKKTGDRKSLWQKNVSVAVLNYNTSYHACTGCEPSRVFHGRMPYNVLDMKMGIRPQKSPTPISLTARGVIDQTEMIFQGVREIAMEAHIKYKA